MLKLTVPEMTCGHCEGVITRAIAEIDSKATVDIDLRHHVVSVNSDAPDDEIRAAIKHAGYAVGDVLEPKPSSSCCGSCHS